MSTPLRSEIELIESLALNAKRFDSEELWDSAASIEAENELFDAARTILRGEAWEKLEHYCLKATLSERIDAAVSYVRGEVGR